MFQMIKHIFAKKKKNPIITCFQYMLRPYHHTPYTQYYYFAYHLNPRVVAQGYVITLNNLLIFSFNFHKKKSLYTQLCKYTFRSQKSCQIVAKIVKFFMYVFF
jgi:hypothetical protein